MFPRLRIFLPLLLFFTVFVFAREARADSFVAITSGSIVYDRINSSDRRFFLEGAGLSVRGGVRPEFFFKTPEPGGTFFFTRELDHDPLNIGRPLIVGGFSYSEWNPQNETFFLRMSAPNIVLPDLLSTSVTFTVPFTMSGSISAGRFQADVPLNRAELFGEGIATATFSRGSSGPWILNRMTYTFGPQADPVPEPATLLLLGTGLVGVAVKSRRQFRRRK